MITPDDAALHAQLADDEGTGPMQAGRFLLYDDATGRALVPGVTLRGNPTIGYGVNLTVGLSHDEVSWLLTNRIGEAEDGLRKALPWLDALPEGAARVLVNLAYNAGVGGALGFRKALVAMQAGDWLTAAREIEASQLPPRRAAALADLLRALVK